MVNCWRGRWSLASSTIVADRAPEVVAADGMCECGEDGEQFSRLVLSSREHGVFGLDRKN